VKVQVLSDRTTNIRASVRDTQFELMLAIALVASISSNWVSRTEARMLVVRSERTCTFTDFGRLSVSCGSIWPTPSLS
jgi:hypothetical protein